MSFAGEPTETSDFVMYRACSSSRIDGVTCLFASHFDEAIDEYEDFYAVDLMPSRYALPPLDKLMAF